MRTSARSSGRLTPRGSARRKIRNRLLRIEGQARGIRRMLEEQRDCGEILVQLAALRQATNGVAVALFQAHAEDCIQEHMETADATEALHEIRSTFQQVLAHG
jgi:DNA-binding FrmR family transcriptional regulator